jgi:FtsP/CotA-like multicopper oxidase with cupredoxin domain
MADMGMAGMDMSGSADTSGAADASGMAGMPGMDTKPAADASMAGMNMGKPAATSPGASMAMPSTPADKAMADMPGMSASGKPVRAPERELLVRLTGDMTRYFWSINDKKLSNAKPFKIGLGERVRIKMVNETMMEHPMHLHGVFMELVNGNGIFAPRKHTIIVPPAQTVELDVTYEDEGTWAFHCHLFYHAVTGMFRLVEVA